MVGLVEGFDHTRDEDPKDWEDHSIDDCGNHSKKDNWELGLVKVCEAADRNLRKFFCTLLDWGGGVSDVGDVEASGHSE